MVKQRKVEETYWLDEYGRQINRQNRSRIRRCIQDFINTICDKRTTHVEANRLITDTLAEMAESQASMKDYFTDDWPKGL